MNKTFLYAATVALALASTLAMAQQQAPLSRDQVNAETRQARQDGTLRRTDYDDGSYRPQAAPSSVTRADVGADLAQARLARQSLAGPLADSRYNEYGTAVLQVSTLPRRVVRDEVLAAAAAGTLQRTDYDDAASLARKADQHAAGERFAHRVKAKFAPQG